MIIFVFSLPSKASELRYGEVEPLYDIISPLRVLLSAPEEMEAFFGLESHLEKWKEDEGFVESHEAVVDVMRDSLGFDDAEQVAERTAVKTTTTAYDYSVPKTVAYSPVQAQVKPYIEEGRKK